jgi:hypothetical protein
LTTENTLTTADTSTRLGEVTDEIEAGLADLGRSIDKLRAEKRKLEEANAFLQTVLETIIDLGDLREMRMRARFGLSVTRQHTEKS